MPETDDGTTILASITGTPSSLQEMISNLSIDGGGESIFGTLYFDVRDGFITSLAAVGANSAMMYSTIEEGRALESITLHESNGDGDGVSSMFRSSELRSYIDIVGGEEDGTITIEFCGDPDDQVVNKARIRGELEADVYLPASAADLEMVPFPITRRFSDSDEFYKAMPDEDEPEPGTFATVIDTNVGTMQRIVDVVEESESADDMFPIKVEDGDFKVDLDTRESRRDSVRGTLHGADVKGPDLHTEYSDRFRKIASTIRGDVRLSSTPDNAPLVTVRKTENETYRYIIAQVQNQTS